MRDPWIDHFVAAGLGGGIVTVLWTQASIVPTGLVARMLVTILAAAMVWRCGRQGIGLFETG